MTDRGGSFKGIMDGVFSLKKKRKTLDVPQVGAQRGIGVLICQRTQAISYQYSAPSA